MRYPLYKAISTLALILLVGCAAEAVKEPPDMAQAISEGAGVSAPAPQPEAAEPEPQYVIELEAIHALEDMGHYLRTLKAYSVKTQSSRDEILDYGQKIMVDSESTITVQGDNRLHIANKSVLKDNDRQFFFDGQTFTIYGNQNQYYASLDAPGNIRELLDIVWNRFGLEIPQADLFRWGRDEDDKEDILAASYLGPAEVNGTPCNHFAFRSSDVDWQLWLERDAKPLPLKLVITNTRDPALPQYISVMRWNLAPKINRKLFTYVPSKAAHKVELTGTLKSEENNFGDGNEVQ